MYDEWTPDDTSVDDAPGRYWTWRRVLMLLIILITLIAFVVYTFSPLITGFIQQLAPPEPPIELPDHLITNPLQTGRQPV